MTNNIRVLESDLEEVKFVYHVSDIHIRKRLRHDEYIIVFNRFCSLVQKHIDTFGKTCLIVVTGDVMHDKTEMVPESIDMLRRFLIMLSDLTEVVMIIGNHDTNIFNKNSLDCLTPIVSNLHTQHKIHLLTENAIYIYSHHDLLIGVTTLWAEKVTVIDESVIKDVYLTAQKSKIKLSKNLTKIGLYHGMIHGCTLDNGTKADLSTNTTCFNRTDFECYDIVMLGDVHKHQFLNKSRKMAYAGSLIQQKRDEDLLEHGAILWDIEKLKGKFLRIKNDFGMIQIKIGSNKKEIMSLKQKLTDEYDNIDLPKNLDIKMIYNSIEGKNAFKSTYETITKSHNIVKVTEITDTSDVSGIPVDFQQIIKKNDFASEKGANLDEKIKPIKITDNDAVLKIMMDHLSFLNIKQSDSDNLTQTAIKNEINDILNEIDYNYDREIKNIRLKSIQFNNMFIYVENNTIDFTRFKNIVGLNASNYQGKSSFIDVILYSIYGECSRGKRYDVLNIRKKKMNSKVVLEVNGKEYIISRTSQVNSVSKRDLKEHVSVWENGENITADDRVKTHQLICKKICSYDDMINNSFVLQKNGRTFVDLTDREKKDLLCKMARLDIFDSIFVEAKSRHSSSGQLIGKLIKKLENYDDIFNEVMSNSKPNSKPKPKPGVKKNSKSTSRSISKTGTDLNGKMTMIEREFNNRLKSKSDQIENLEKAITILEENLNMFVKEYHELDVRLTLYNANKDMFKNYDDEKQLLNKLNAEVLVDMGEIFCLRSKIDKVKQGKSMTILKKEHDRIIENNKIALSEIDKTIEFKLRQLTNIDTNLGTLERKKCNLIDKLKQHAVTQKQIESNLESIEKVEILFDVFKKIHSDYLGLLLEKDTIEGKIKFATDNIEKNQNQIIDLENHEYNPNCDKCMKNPVTKTLIECKKLVKCLNDDLKKGNNELKKILLQIDSKIEELFEINLNNADTVDKDNFVASEVLNSLELKVKSKDNVTRQIDKIHQQINDINSDIVRTDFLIKAISTNNEIEEEINNLKLKRNSYQGLIKTDYDICVEYDKDKTKCTEKVSAKLDRIIHLDQTLRNKAFSYNEHIVNSIEESSNIKKNILLKNEIETIKEQIRDNKKFLVDLNNEKIKLEIDLNKFLEIKDEIDKTEKKKLITGYIKKILDKNGLVDTLLSKNIIPYLQKSINGILADVGHYQVSIEYKNQSVNVYKDSGLNVTMSSGYESYLLDLVFRLALVQINNHVKTDFLLIDEGFNACDSDNKNNVKELLEHMRSYYTWILIISHDEFIKSFYDMDIRIQSVKDGSRLRNTDNNVIDVDDNRSDEKNNNVVNVDSKTILKKVSKKVPNRVLKKTVKVPR